MDEARKPGFSRCNNATLRRAARSLGRFYDDALAPSGLKGTQFGLLFQIHISDEPAMGTIAEALIMDLSALGHTLKPLIRDGYVETFPDKDDRRVKRLVLTEAGKAAIVAGEPLRRELIEGVFAVLPPPEQTQLLASLEKLHAHLADDD